MGNLPSNYRPQDIGQPAATYSVVQDDEDDTYSHKVYEPNGRDFLGANFTEAQAEIFAFALNGIMSGHKLSITEHTPGFDPIVIDTYDGPTEGVRS